MTRRANLIITVISALLCGSAQAGERFELVLRLQNDSAAVLPAAEVCGLKPLSLNGRVSDWRIEASSPVRMRSREYCLQHEELGPYQSQRISMQWQPGIEGQDEAWTSEASFDLIQEPSEQLRRLAKSFAIYPRRERVERIFAWMVEHIAFFGIRRGVEGAEHALQVGGGDCTEHMLLAGELLERNGVTVRRILGAVVPNEQHRISASGLHNWIEYRDNGRWLVFDSSRRLLGAPKDSRYLGLLFYSNTRQLSLQPLFTDSPSLKLFLQ